MASSHGDGPRRELCVLPRHGPLCQRQGKRASRAARMHPVATTGTRIFVAALFHCQQSWRNVAMAGTVTIASLQSRGVRQLLVYCLGKREGDWPCRYSGKLPIERLQADEVLSEIERRCRCTVCGWRRADLRPDYSKQQASRQGGVGWMMPPV